jgi:glutamate-1-semialdehyde 2,1-aminomutase
MATTRLAAAERLLDGYAAELSERTPCSYALYQKAQRLLPGGTGRNATAFWPYPIYARAGEGPHLVDLDGNRYVDLSLDGGACILGHAPPALLNVLRDQAGRGMLLAMATEAEVMLAERLNQRMPFLEMMRFLNTGSEPEQIGLRIARAFTRRPKIAKVEGHHHGQSDFVLFSHIAEVAGPDHAPKSVADDAGLPPQLAELVVTLPFNNTEAAVALIEQHAGELAAVLIEPLMLWGGAVPAEADYFQAIRDVTQRLGIVLIVDEVPLGVRFGPGGAVSEYGITPDIWTTGKALFGGIAHGLLGGRHDIFDKVVTPPFDPRTKVFCSGTFSANPLAIGAAHVVLDELADGSAVAYMDRLSERLRQSLRTLGQSLDLPLQVTGTHSIFAIHFSEQPIRNFRDVMAGHRGFRRAFYTGLMARGVLWPPGRPSGFVSTAHTDADIDRVLEAAESVLRDIRTVWHDN